MINVDIDLEIVLTILFSTVAIIYNSYRQDHRYKIARSEDFKSSFAIEISTRILNLFESYRLIVSQYEKQPNCHITIKAHQM